MCFVWFRRSGSDGFEAESTYTRRRERWSVSVCEALAKRSIEFMVRRKVATPRVDSTNPARDVRVRRVEPKLGER
jgi:hypothetical protein